MQPKTQTQKKQKTTGKAAILQLIERFERGLESARDGDYTEASLRRLARLLESDGRAIPMLFALNDELRDTLRSVHKIIDDLPLARNNYAAAAFLLGQLEAAREALNNKNPVNIESW